MRPIYQFMNQKLKQICQEAIRLETLNMLIKKQLPDPLKECCSVGSFDKGILKILVKSPEWATILRFELPNLRDYLRKEGFYQLSTIKIIPEMPKQTQSIQHKKPVLTEKAQSIIKESSKFCQYSPLKLALLKLARENNST